MNTITPVTKKLKVPLTLEGMDGNAYAILGAFNRAARRKGYSEATIKAVLDDATSGDYNHLLRTIISNTIPA